MAAPSCTTLAAAALLAALAAGGCGSGAGGGTLGRRVFDSSCRDCHSLTGHDTKTEGGDLATGSMSLADVESFTRVMPTRVKLSAAEIRAVSAYVVARQR
jgi:mono/diheme cytochrome c family protein